jgi:RNA polymerase sigma-70 factor (ECF subfamily)
MVGGICRALLRDPHEAEDASQQTFLSAYNSLLGGAVPQDEAAWLATIARNECRLRIRKRMATPLPLDFEVESRGDDPAELAGRRAELADVTAALAGLPERQREAVVLRTFLGLSYDEVSAAMDSSPPAVESLLSRARSRLNRQLRRAPELARGPLAVAFSIRDAFERLVNALVPTAEQAAAGGGGAIGPRGSRSSRPPPS